MLDEQRINDMLLVLRREMPEYHVETDADFDRDATTFRFKEDNRIVHVLKIEEEVLEQNSPSEILHMLQQLQWRSELAIAGPNPILLTSTSLRLL
jgi:hypothetical protein